jgi:quercetin dioxygenase-like cupin family protein
MARERTQTAAVCARARIVRPRHRAERDARTRGGRVMGDSSITKVNVATSPKGRLGQKYLACGLRMGMRLWEKEPPGDLKPLSTRDYETVGFVLEGKAELHLEGQIISLQRGDSYVVPKGSSHAYKILETFTAVEATSPPSSMHGRDDRVSTS